MSDQEMKDIWLSTDGLDKIILDSNTLVSSLNSKMNKLDRTLFFRDLREIIAALFVMVFLGYKSVVEADMVNKITSALIVIWAAYVVYRLLDVRKYKKMIDMNQTLKEQLLQRKTYLEQQAYLLDNALYFYIGPLNIILIFRIIYKSFGMPVSLQLFSIVVVIGSLFLLSWGLTVLNKKAAKIAYLPLIKNIDEVLVGLDEE